MSHVVALPRRNRRGTFGENLYSIPRLLTCREKLRESHERTSDIGRRG
jgi:hypothetical protein